MFLLFLCYMKYYYNCTVHCIFLFVSFSVKHDHHLSNVCGHLHTHIMIHDTGRACTIFWLVLYMNVSYMYTCKVLLNMFSAWTLFFGLYFT